MPDQFDISLFGTFRWVDNNIVSAYNTLPLESQQDELSYQQPIQCGGSGYQSDVGTIQITSDFVPTAGLYDIFNTFIKAITLTAIDPPILGVTFICYNGTCDFSDVDPGLYYAKITYTDGDMADHDWRTSPLDVQVFHDGTQLIEATNFTNDKGVVFVNADLTTLTISFRVGSIIRLPLVKTDAQDYEDQYNDLEQETSIPFVTYTQILYGPSSFLLPFWVIEKINLLYSLNQVLIDGQPFAKLSASDFKPTRSDIGTVANQGAFWAVEIQPNFNYPSEQFITGTPPDPNGIVFVKMYKTYKHKSADFAVAGIFNSGINLIRVAVVNNGGDAFTMKIGTSDGDDSLGTIVFPDDNTDSIDIGKLFEVPTTIWISGIAGTDLNITLDWNDYNAKPIIPPDPTPLWRKNTLYYFEEISSLFEDAFDVSTGMGQEGTDWEGCVLADGRNGVPNRIGLLVRSWNSLEVLPANTRGTTVGANSMSLTTNQMPEHNHLIANADVHGSGPGGDLAVGQVLIRKWDSSINAAYNLQGSSTAPDRGTTSNAGAGDPIDITNHAVTLPAFYYIGT